MKRNWVIFLAFVATYACREPFDFSYAEIENPKVIIDGFITNRATAHEVRVSFSTRINDFNIVETDFIENADVRVEDDEGGFTALTHTRAGIYVTAPEYRAQEGRSYTLSVTLADGRQFRSAPATMPEASPATANITELSSIGQCDG